MNGGVCSSCFPQIRNIPVGLQISAIRVSIRTLVINMSCQTMNNLFADRKEN